MIFLGIKTYSYTVSYLPNFVCESQLLSLASAELILCCDHFWKLSASGTVTVLLPRNGSDPFCPPHPTLRPPRPSSHRNTIHTHNFLHPGCKHRQKHPEYKIDVKLSLVKIFLQESEAVFANTNNSFRASWHIRDI